MVEFSEDFEGAADGATANTLTTGFTGATNNAQGTHSSLKSILGSKSFRIYNPTATLALWIDYSAAPRSVVYSRVYWCADDMTNGATVMGTYTSGTAQANVQISATGGIRLRDATTIITTATTVANLHQWYRFEHFVDSAVGTQKLRIFTGPNLHGTVPDEEITATCAVATFTRASIGTAAANTLEWFWDAYANDPTTWLGPVSVPATNEILLESGAPLGMESSIPLLLES
jgi:hypothetical protein